MLKIAKAVCCIDLKVTNRSGVCRGLLQFVYDVVDDVLRHIYARCVET